MCVHLSLSVCMHECMFLCVYCCACIFVRMYVDVLLFCYCVLTCVVYVAL